MILKSYLFAQNSDNYQQYTSDYSGSFLKSVCKNCKADDQIAIHRDGNLIYYAYAHRITDKEIYGLCVVCGEVCLNIQGLYDFLRKSIESQANKGVLFHYDGNGVIRKNIDILSSQPAEIDSLFRDVKQYLDKKSNFWEPLPPEDLSVPLTGSITLSFSDDEKSKILESIRHYHNIYITLENSIPSSFSNTVSRVCSENKELSNEIVSLKETIAKLDKQKKQVAKVVFLIISLLICIIGLFIFGNNVQNLKHKIDEQTDIISETQSKLDAEISIRKELQVENSNYISEINKIKSYLYMNGSTERKEKPNSDNSWVEWIEVKSPVKINSFYTIPSNTGDVTISAYNLSHERIASSTVSITSTGWQKVILTDFCIDTPGKYYICIENTAINLAYHSSGSYEYDLYKHGLLQLIGATRKDTAEKDDPSIGTGYYQYFYSIEYSLL